MERPQVQSSHIVDSDLLFFDNSRDDAPDLAELDAQDRPQAAGELVVQEDRIAHVHDLTPPQ